MIEISNITKSYGEKKALVDFSLKIGSGVIYGFLGPNGSGKTTLMKIIAGILKQDSGNVKIEGHDVLQDPIPAKINIGYVPDEPCFYNNITGIRYLNFISDIFGLTTEERKKRVEYYSEAFKMTEYLSMPAGSYSHGTKQKLSIISALIHKPRYYLMDEPLVGLDLESIECLKEFLRQDVKDGSTVFYSTHVLDVAVNFCDSIAILSNGRLQYSGKNKSDLKELYFSVVSSSPEKHV